MIAARKATTQRNFHVFCHAHVDLDFAQIFNLMFLMRIEVFPHLAQVRANLEFKHGNERRFPTKSHHLRKLRDAS